MSKRQRQPNFSAPAKALPAFIQKLFEIAHTAPPTLISWNSNGDSIIIHDPPSFSSQVLSKYFKSSNFTSFVRQLHFYGFHKIDKDKTLWEFKNDNFLRGREDLLSLIRRKTSSDYDNHGKKELVKLRKEVDTLQTELADVKLTLSKVLSTLTAVMQDQSVPMYKRRRLESAAKEEGVWDSLSNAVELPQTVVKPPLLSNSSADWASFSPAIEKKPTAAPPATLFNFPAPAETAAWPELDDIPSLSQSDSQTGFLDEMLSGLQPSPRESTPTSSGRREFLTLEALDQGLADMMVDTRAASPMPAPPTASATPAFNNFAPRPVLRRMPSSMPLPPPVPAIPSVSSAPSPTASSTSALPSWGELRRLSRKLPPQLKQQMTDNLMPELAAQLFSENPDESGEDGTTPVSPATIIAAIASSLVPPGSSEQKQQQPAEQRVSCPSGETSPPSPPAAAGSSADLPLAQLPRLLLSLLMPKMQMALVAQLRQQQQRQPLAAPSIPVL